MTRHYSVDSTRQSQSVGFESTFVFLKGSKRRYTSSMFKTSKIMSYWLHLTTI
jgi:hypothetical protein